MYRQFAALAACAGIWAAGTAAHAGVYADDLAKCLVKSSTAEDQTVLVDWVFVAMSAHPSVQVYAKVSDDQREQANKQVAKLFERLLTVDCRAETVAALKFEGLSAIEPAFNVLGQVAMRSLMSDPHVQQSITAMARDADQSKLQALAKEAGVGANAPSPASPPK